MLRFILTANLAWLLAACAQPAVQPPAGAADPHAPVPATLYQPALDRHAAAPGGASPDRTWRDANATVGGRNPMGLTMPGRSGEHAHDAAPADAGMDMQCTAGGGDGKGCRAGMHAAGHAPHRDDMTGKQCMADGKCACCAGMTMHGAAAGQSPTCEAGGTCGCRAHKEAM